VGVGISIVALQGGWNDEIQPDNAIKWKTSVIIDNSSGKYALEKRDVFLADG